jgi:hypothetical protein
MSRLKTTGLLVAVLVLLGTVASSAASAVVLPRIEQINFNENVPVIVDHQKNTAHGEEEKGVTIEEVEGKDSIEWKGGPKEEVKKNWPLAYVQGASILIQQIQIPVVEAGTRKFLESEIEEPPRPRLVGEATIKEKKYTFSKEWTVAEIKKQITEHKEFITTGALVTSAALPKEIFNEAIKIKWKWVVKEKGGATIEQTAGESTHNLYTTFATALTGAEVFLTFLDLATEGAQKEVQPPTEASVLAGVWKGFSHVDATLKTPAVNLRVYNPKTGTFVTRAGTVLWYWKEVTPNQALGKKELEEVDEVGKEEAGCALNPTAEVLKTLKGRCDQWAVALKNALAIEGIKSEWLQLTVKFAGEGKICEASYECVLLVKNFTFGKETLAGEFPFTLAETKHGEGIAGQGIKNPPPGFYNHYVVKAGAKGSASIYDPSYGTTPLKGGEKPTEKSVLEELQTNAMAGFCRPAKAGEVGADSTACQKVPAKLQLAATKEDGTAGFEFP